MTNDGASGIKRKKKQNMREMRIFTKASGQVIFFVSEFSGNLLFRRLLRFDVQFVQNGQRLLLAATSEEKEKEIVYDQIGRMGNPLSCNLILLLSLIEFRPFRIQRRAKRERFFYLLLLSNDCRELMYRVSSNARLRSPFSPSLLISLHNRRTC